MCYTLSEEKRMDKLMTQEINCNACGKKVKIRKYKGKVDPYTCSKCRGLQPVEKK